MPSSDDERDRSKTPSSDDVPTAGYGGSQATPSSPGPFTPEPALRPLNERFEILGEVGRGGMGIVYRARDRETNEIVALKILKPEIASDSAVMERFINELRLARKITHKNVCRTYDLHRFGPVAAIAMEYVEGESLRQILNRFGGLPLRKGIQVAAQISDALQEAHRQSIVHRDLKPENVMLDREGNVKVMDFGIARSLETTATMTGGTMGTPAYMSPEQAEGKPADSRSDIYSLGLMLYEIFTGRQAFRAETPAALLHMHIHETPSLPRQVEPYLPAFLDRAIRKCLAKNAKDRFQSAEQLAEVLSDESSPEAVPEAEAKPRDRLSQWEALDTLLLVLGIAGLICFLALRDEVFPGSKTRLEIDALGARQKAKALDKGFGRPSYERMPAQLEADYFAQFWWITYVGTDDPFTDISKLELPLHWIVAWDFPPGAREDQVTMDSKGNVEHYFHQFWDTPYDYRAPPVEQRREVARRVVEQTCGPLPPGSIPIEMAGGNLGGTYNVFWRIGPAPQVEGKHVAEVSLVSEKVQEVKCRPSSAVATFLYFVSQRQAGSGAPIWLLLSWLTVFIVPIAFLVYFSTGECYRSPLLWKRSPLALALGIIGTWVLVPSFLSSRPGFFAMLGMGVAASLLLLVGLVAVEHRLTRVAPGWIATYALAFRGTLLEPAVGLAIVRGALAGMFLGGIETLGAYVSVMAYPRLLDHPSIPGSFCRELFFFWLDPTAPVDATVSFSPALFAALSAIFHGLLLGFLFTGFVLVISSKRLLKSPQVDAGRAMRLEERLALVVLSALILAFPVFALRMHFARTVGPGAGGMLVLLLFGAFLGWLALNYDLLTAVAAIATYVFWTLNYPLLGIFEIIGNGSEWGAFLAWGAVVVAAALVGLRPKLLSAWQRLRAETG